MQTSNYAFVYIGTEAARGSRGIYLTRLDLESGEFDKLLATNKNDRKIDERIAVFSIKNAISVAGLVAQPVVWVSLFSVATTRAGLPAGPFGLLGAVEGVSYLVVLGYVASSIARRVTGGANQPEGIVAFTERLSYVTILAGLFTLASLVAQQGCIPNAKPILDYSDYLPVCEAQPGLFGG